jgi:ferritin heavy chain
VELSVSYVYLALAAFFDRDNVGLPGFAAYFRESRQAALHLLAHF